jgi:replicative DNA helicase
MTEWDDDEHTPCEGQGEFIVAKHRNGGLESIKLKFTGHLAQFSNLDDDFSSEFQSKMNDAISSGNMPSAQDAFGTHDNLDDTVPF